MPNDARHPSRVTRHALPYFPGCALKDQARGFELSALAAMEKLGWELAELPRWNCCGTVYSLSSDDLMRHIAPVRNLTRVQELGGGRLLTVCSMCYNTLKRSARFVLADPERLSRINAFMDEEPDYMGGVEVYHLLQFLRDVVGYEEIEEHVKRPLFGLKVTPYYGCMLLRPREIGIDDPDAPEVMERLFTTLGAEVIDSPQKVECCGSYQAVAAPDIVVERTEAIVGATASRGGELIVTSCPLCQFNLEEHQRYLKERDASWREVPVLYFTQLLALALGAKENTLGFELLRIDPRPLLQGELA